MEDIERIKQRLDNVQSVAPILTALRNIAAGSWHMARARLEAAFGRTSETARAVAAIILKNL
mgnify:CR=1 FL=1